MKQQNKPFLIFVGSLTMLCLCIGAASFVGTQVTKWIVSETFQSDPDTVTAVGNSIADYTLPAGFGDGYAVKWSDFSMVMYTAVDNSSHIYLLQTPGSVLLDRETLEWQMRQVTNREDISEARIIDSQPCPIRGEETTLIISEGTNNAGQLYRSASAVFTGNEGAALVSISAPTNSWDQEMVEKFIESLQ